VNCYNILYCLNFFQCLSNTSGLTKYFIGSKSGYKPYKKHINKDNPLGMGGAIAEAYGALLEDMWSGKVACVAPRQFKVRGQRSATWIRKNHREQGKDRTNRAKLWFYSSE